MQLFAIRYVSADVQIFEKLVKIVSVGVVLLDLFEVDAQNSGHHKHMEEQKG
jgi:hypothetical protein